VAGVIAGFIQDTTSKKEFSLLLLQQIWKSQIFLLTFFFMDSILPIVVNRQKVRRVRRQIKMIITGVVNSLVEYIREKIITGELAPGQKLNEIQLAAEFNISRPPLREAFRTLENNHLVVSIPRKGCCVSKISIEDLRNVYEARVMIECYAIDLLKKKRATSVSELLSLFKAAAEFGSLEWQALAKKERVEKLRILADFHTKLVESAGNDLLLRFHQTIIYNLARYQYKYPYGTGTFQNSQEHHQQIIEEIRAGQFKRAKNTLEKHLRTFVEILEKSMREENLHGTSPHQRSEEDISSYEPVLLGNRAVKPAGAPTERKE
jgi:DNA-binding GntR family transcriptional regulator